MITVDRSSTEMSISSIVRPLPTEIGRSIFHWKSGVSPGITELSGIAGLMPVAEIIDSTWHFTGNTVWVRSRPNEGSNSRIRTQRVHRKFGVLLETTNADVFQSKGPLAGRETLGRFLEAVPISRPFHRKSGVGPRHVISVRFVEVAKRRLRKPTGIRSGGFDAGLVRRELQRESPLGTPLVVVQLEFVTAVSASSLLSE